MDDKELRDQLRKLSIPEPSDTARERARHRALLAFQNGGAENKASDRPWIRTLAWCSGTTAVTLLAAILFLRSTPKVEIDSLAKDRETLKQTEVLFPGQLNALIERDGKIRIELADRPSSPNDQPILIQFKQNGRSFRVLSYSGRRVCVEVNGKSVCFEALVTGDSTVILSGDNFVWNSQNPTALSGYRVEARVLASTL
jgi:hypothetical protein